MLRLYDIKKSLTVLNLTKTSTNKTKIISYSILRKTGSMHDTGCLGLVHWDNPEGWYGEGGGFRMGNTCIPVVDSF